MASRHHNITVDIGADYNANVYAYANGSTATPINLSTYTAANAVVVKSYYYNPSRAATFNVYFMDATAGVVNLVLNQANTSTLSPGKYVYDVMITNSATGERTRILEGILTARAGVST